MRERTDGELVLEALQGRADAFGTLVSRYMRPGYLVALSLTGQPQDAEDVAQESFLVALRRLEECRDPERFGGWFLAIVRNRAKNLVRRERIRRADALPEARLWGPGGPEEDFKRAEIRRRLEEAMEGLSAIRREVLLLHDLEGWKHREIGEKLGVPDGTVRSHLHFARRHVRARLQGLDPRSQSAEEL